MSAENFEFPKCSYRSITLRNTPSARRVGRRMFAQVTTIAFEGVEARAVDVYVQIGPARFQFR